LDQGPVGLGREAEIDVEAALVRLHMPAASAVPGAACRESDGHLQWRCTV
jgi:hypothetical protein